MGVNAEMAEFENYQVLEKFPFAGELLEAVPYGSGHINDTYRLTFREDGKEVQYILQRINGEIFRDQDQLMENIERVTSFIAGKIRLQGGNPDPIG